MHFRNKKGKYLKGKINEPATNSTNKNIRGMHRGINDLKRGYQPRSDLSKDENADLLADSHNILNKYKKYQYFSRLLNIHRVSDVRQIEIHAVEPLVPDPSPFEAEIVIAKLKRYKASGSKVSLLISFANPLSIRASFLKTDWKILA
jgi:hypothetical protein